MNTRHPLGGGGQDIRDVQTVGPRAQVGEVPKPGVGYSGQMAKEGVYVGDLSKAGGGQADAARISGSVKMFLRQKGYGFVNTDDAPDKDVFVHWKDLEVAKNVSTPALKKTQRVTFELKTKEDGNICAIKVRDENGQLLTTDAGSHESDWKREFVSKKVYEGNIKFFNFSKGYGYLSHSAIQLEDGTLLEDDLFFHSRDVLTPNGRFTHIPRGATVEFQVYKDEKGYGAARCYITSVPYFYSGRNGYGNRKPTKRKKADGEAGKNAGPPNAGFSLHGLSPSQVKISVVSDQVLQIELMSPDMNWKSLNLAANPQDPAKINNQTVDIVLNNNRETRNGPAIE